MLARAGLVFALGIVAQVVLGPAGVFVAAGSVPLVFRWGAS